MLSSIISPQTCAQCRLCCHFEPPSVWEMPCIELRLIELYREDGIELSEPRLEGGRSFHLDFTHCPDGGSLNCPLLDPSSGCCRPTEERPFECLVWPLRLMMGREGAEASHPSITYYRDCPALASESSRESLYTLVTEGGIGVMMRAFYRQHPESCRSYRESYEILLPLHELDHASRESGSGLACTDLDEPIDL